MDPLALGVAFLLTILGGGFVAVLAQYLAFRDAKKLAHESYAGARRLAEEERKAHERSLLVAVVHELAANGTALNAGSGGTGLALLRRSAWDEARRVVLPTEAAAALAAAYLYIDLYNSRVTSLQLAIPLGHAELVEGIMKSTDSKGIAGSFARAIEEISQMGIKVYENR